jgi:D-alanyl-D-alanine carboxypeptidase
METQVASLSPAPVPVAPKPPAVETPRFQAAGLGFTGITSDVAEGDNGGQIDLASLTSATGNENSTEEPGETSWGIQVGAFSQKSSAEAQVQNIAKTADDIIGEAEAVVTPFKTANGILYRVRFGPFAPKDAKAACAALRARNMSCLAVADSDWAVARN